MLDPDQLFQDIVDTEDELEQKQSKTIEERVRKIITDKYGDDAIKYLDNYYSDSPIEEDDLCPDCTKNAKELIEKVQSIADNIINLNNNYYDTIYEKLKENNDEIRKDIDKIFIKRFASILCSLGYTELDNMAYNTIASMYLMNLSLLYYNKREKEEEDIDE